MFDLLSTRTAAIALALILALTATGCSSKRRVTNPDNLQWFCQSDESGNGWDCVQDNNLAQQPVVTRLPPQIAGSAAEPEAAADQAGVASVEAATAPAASAEALGGDIADLSVDPREEMRRMQAAEHKADEAPPKPPAEGEPGPPAVAQPEPPLNAATVDAIESGEAADVPEYVRLAYVPTNPTPLLELPGDYYALRVFTMSSREQIEQYVTQNNLQGISSARIAQNGNLYYVLVLGVYSTYERAEQAMSELPAPLADANPQLQEVSALQEAIRNGDALALDNP